MGEQFPNLRDSRFSTDCIDYDFSSFGGPLDLKKKHIEKFLQANQQLRCLDIMIMELLFAKLLDMVSEHIDFDRKGTISASYNNKYVKTVQLMRLARQHPMMVELDMYPYLFEFVEIFSIPCKRSYRIPSLTDPIATRD